MKSKKDDVRDLLLNADLSSYRAVPFWSWNDKLEKAEMINQIHWMKEQGFGGFFMHARAGLTTEYLSDEWFDLVDACVQEGDKLGMSSWAYDENGWPSGFVGGKLLEDEENRDYFLTYTIGIFDEAALVSYRVVGDEILRVDKAGKGVFLNIYNHVSPSTADILNPQVVDKFIALTHEKYKENLGDKFNSSLKGFFTDEPQYQRWGVPFTKMIVKFFEEEYNQDVLDGLGLLFLDKKGYKSFRYKYYKGMQSLMLKNFAEKLYSWCDKNGTMLTGHYVEELSLSSNMMACAGIMPFYEFMHVPGIDHLCLGDDSPIAPKQVYSVARQLGKKVIMTETFGCCGWETTPNEFKRIAEKQFVAGVNFICQHLLPYSEHGQRKRDYPAHFSWANPWVKYDYKSFNDYFARLGYLLGESEDNVSVAMFNPIRSMYFEYKREEADIKKYDLDTSYINLGKKLSNMNVDYHIVDETVMARHGKVLKDELIVGNCAYKYIVFPKTHVLDGSTKTLLDKFIKNGGKVLFTDGYPTYLDGEEYSFGYKSNVTFEEIIANQPIKVDNINTKVQSTVRTIDGKTFIYAVNLSRTESVDLTFSGNFKSFISLDIENLKEKELSNKVHFEPLQSYVLFLSDKEKEFIAPKKTFNLDSRFKVVSSSDNYYTLDKMEFSFDGVNYSGLYSYMGVFNELLDKRYKGEVYLRYTFDVDVLPNRIHFLSEDMHNQWSECNGVKFEYTGVSDFEKKIYRADITNLVKKGKNVIVTKIDFYESEQVFYALFGENVTEGVKNCLTYDTTIESCYLQGDFAVYSRGEFTNGVDERVLYADDFYIGAKKEYVTELVKDGYPFFAGSITLEKEFDFDPNYSVLNLDGNFCLSEISINGKKVEKSYFAKQVDLTGYAVSGKNTLTVTLWTENRNLLGPHHYAVEEIPPFVGPAVFELLGTWKDGKSSEERENYSFIKFGLFKN